MRLKHLELQGYKSFANRTEFIFDEQITAIVGPNGAGKSNIADALRWALGEQSYAALRAKRTEDMIFAGSDGRPRQGMAEVTLTLDNTDGALPIAFTEVTLTRRAYRSGENEYFINGARVRLREVLDLLGAAGLSRNPYLVIGQGLVDAALALRPDQRRELIDEAAGIRPYQLKRDNALSRLAETQANMVRANDILNELSPRLRRLEQHAERAYEHARLSQELKDLLVTWYGYQWHHAQEQLREAKARRQSIAQLMARHEAELRELNQRIVECRVERESQRGRLADLRRQEARLRGQYEEVRRSLAVRQERARLLADQQGELEQEVEALRAQVKATQAEIAEMEAGLRRLEEDSVRQAAWLEECRAAVQGLEARYASLQQSLTTTQARLLDLASRLADRRGRLAHLEARQTELRRAIEDSRQTVSRLEAERASARHELQEAEARLVKIQQELAGAKSQMTHLRVRLMEVQAHAERRQAELDEMAETLRRLTTRRDALAEVRARARDADAVVQRVIETHKGRRLADLIQVPPELEPAVEAALGDRLWSVIVETQDQAVEALKDLWATGAGRVTFLPLDALRPPDPIRLHSDRPGLLGRLCELIHCEDRFRPAVESLLGATWLVEDLDLALELWEGTPGIRFVTRRGEVLEPTGIVTGGQAQAGSGLLALRAEAQEREWQELLRQIQAVEAARKLRVAELAQAATGTAPLDEELERLEARERRLSEVLHEAQERQKALSSQMEWLEQELSWRSSLLERSQAELEAVTGELEAQQARLAADEQAQASCAAELQALQEEWTRQQVARLHALQPFLHPSLQGKEERLTEGEASVRARQEGQLLRDLAAAETAAALTSQKLETTRASLAGRQRVLSQLQERLNARVQRLEAMAGELKDLGQEIQGLDAEQQRLGGELAALEGQIQPAEAALDELRERERRLEQEASQVRERRRQAEASEVEVTAEVSRWEERATHLQAEITADLELLAVREDHPLQLALDLPGDLSPLPAVTVIPEGLERQVHDLKRRLRALGPVDPETLAEYESTRERYNFLSEQMADLHEATEDLGQVIAELNQIMAERFNQTFTAVSEAFSRYFTALFGGGTARLVRVESEGILAEGSVSAEEDRPGKPENVGVDIVARPPGKRPQPLALLSGGERALTAVALIFALLEVSKTPFCFLDEVDAMLDEANIERFRQTLQSLAQRVQFIVITHNRGTIEAAHSIYGVSMSEEGVSQVISLKLEEAVR